MRKIIFLIFLAVLANLAFLSVGHGQSSIGVAGFVPETDLNKNSNKIQINLDENQPVFKENKYLYFFEKSLGLRSEQQGSELPAETHSPYDRIFSAVLMVILMLILAIFVWLLLRLIDGCVGKYRINKIKNQKKHLVKKQHSKPRYD